MKLIPVSNPIYVIEPHADDAFLSMHQHMVEWIQAGQEVGIVTVYSGTRKRERDAENYARAIGASWKGLGLIEAGGGGKCKPEPLAAGIFKGLGLGRPGIPVYVPLSFGHPEHAVVRKAVENYLQLLNAQYLLCYYVDAPYQLTQKLSPALNEALHGMVVESFRKPSMRKWNHIKWFPDQAKFWYFNPPAKLNLCVELLVRKP